MLKAAFESIIDFNYIKVSRENWNKIEELFASKQNTITEQNTVIKALKSEREDLIAELETLRKYKEKDDLLFSYEQSNEALRKQNEVLKSELEGISSDIENINKKVTVAAANESAYLNKIYELQVNPKVVTLDYEEKGKKLLDIYS